ncbi:MAG: Abi family protein [Oscillospiraceae bacterium]|nr:Abi family protein [Oscillospiraceae bacterium]
MAIYTPSAPATNCVDNKSGPPKLSIPQQIHHMKNKGISFSICSETDARSFLAEHNYYYKLKAYAHNFDKYKEGPRSGKYINLDFAHLKDLSTIDAHFRKMILTMCIDLEHFLKVRMLNHCNMVDEDGYEIIDVLFSMQPELKEEIEKKTNTSTCHNIVSKHHNHWAIWNIIELMSFGPFIELYTLFYQRNNFPDHCAGLLFSVKMLRNAAAHNNCLINQMRAPYSRPIKPTYELKHQITKLSSSKKDIVDKYLQHPTIHDFAALLVIYNKLVPDETRLRAMNALKELFDVRMTRNKDYYQKQQGLIASYKFVKEIVDAFVCKK